MDQDCVFMTDFMLELSDRLQKGLGFDIAHRTAAVVSVALFLQDGPVDLSGDDVGVFVKIFIDKPLVVPQIQIRFRAVVSDKDFAVLDWVHGAGIDVDVGIKYIFYCYN